MTLFVSCTDPDIGYFREDGNYVQFAGKITDFGIEITNEYKYIRVKLESEVDTLNFNLEFQIVPNSYNELLENDCDLSLGEKEYTFIASKDPKRLYLHNKYDVYRYCIIGVSDLAGNVYLDREKGKENLLEFTRYGVYG
ncbi:MAG: hypothetical protein K2N18_04680, partial [Clostridia bacterium]|nr:hypothetical protein [Clostridia bacterium]